MLSSQSLILVLAGFCLPNYGTKADPSKIDPELLTSLENGETANVFVFFEKGVEPAIERVNSQRISDRGQRNRALYEALVKHSDEEQGGVLQILSTRGTGDSGGFQYHKSYWTSNKIFLKAANEEIVKAVAEDPKVVKIKREPIARNPEPDEVSRPNVNSPFYGPPTDTETLNRGLWGINVTNVKEAWEELGGRRGEGVIVGNIDSGVRYTHESLRDNFVGEYGWYDPLYDATEPADSDGHGTHTMGTFVGKVFGVAPDAKWMACRSGNESGYHTGEDLLDCIKWMACPTLPDGSNPDCSRAPHIVSNSWVTDRGNEDFNEDILVWREMGIIPVFAIGNLGSSMCNMTEAPGEFPFVIGVGSSNDEGFLDSYSSQGWASDGGIKPDLIAPGLFIASADWENDDWFRIEDGTSVATPLVAGVIALLKTRNLGLTYEEAYNFLTQNTDMIYPDTGPAGDYCKESPIDVFPNIFVGYGQVNALKAVQAQSKVLSEKK